MKSTKSATSFLLLLCTASGVSAFVRQPPAFCSTNNNSSRTTPRTSRPIQAATEDTTEDQDTKENNMGTWNPFSLAVLKLGFTEPAWTSSLNYKNTAGTYRCANCGTPLFSSSGKYDSGSGWPSFWKTIESNRVALERQWDGRIEAKCANCDGHLGHVFPDGPTRASFLAEELESVPESDPDIGYKVQKDASSSRMPRYCVNGIAMRFEEEK